MSLHNEVSNAVSDLIVQYKQAAQDGLSFGEVFQLLVEATGVVVRVIEQFGSGHTSEDKKKAAVEALDALYVDLIEPIDLPGPDILIDRGIKTLIPFMVDWLVGQFNANGWGGDED
jgi:hypothetical protein